MSSEAGAVIFGLVLFIAAIWTNGIIIAIRETQKEKEKNSNVKS